MEKLLFESLIDLYKTSANGVMISAAISIVINLSTAGALGQFLIVIR